MSANKSKDKTIEEELGVTKNEKVCEQISDINGVLKYIITYDVPLRSIHYLYNIVNGKAVKTKRKAKSPDLLDEWIEY